MDKERLNAGDRVRVRSWWDMVTDFCFRINVDLDQIETPSGIFTRDKEIYCDRDGTVMATNFDHTLLLVRFGLTRDSEAVLPRDALIKLPVPLEPDETGVDIIDMIFGGAK